MKLLNSLLGVAAGLCLYTGTAEAQVHLVWPEVGAGVGVFNVGGVPGNPAVQFDFSVGLENEGPYLWSRGFLARFDLLAIDNGFGAFDQVRFDIAPLLTLSTTYETAAPFFRVGAGPLLTFSQTAASLGGHGEVAIGFKSIVDLYLDGKVSADINGTEIGLIAGIRLNAYLFDWFYGGSRGYRVYWW